MVSFQDMDLIRTRPVILVANKIDLARSRAVSSQGMLNNVKDQKKNFFLNFSDL